MGRRKKKKGTSNAASKSAQPDGFGTLGDLLGKRAGTKKRGDTTADASRPRATERRDGPPAEPAPKTRQVTASDLMAEAFEAAGDAGLWEAKFQGRGYTADDVEVVDDEPADGRDDAPARSGSGPALDAMTPEERMFLDAMGGDIEVLDDRDRYADLSDHSFVGASWRDEVELTRMSADALMEPSLTAEQRDTLKRSRKHRLPTLNVRHLSRADALTQVDVFVRSSRIDRHRFVRVIHGKGKQSVGEPVLKRAVIEWCDGSGSLLVKRWAPETDRSGNFGCVVIELRLGA